MTECWNCGREVTPVEDGMLLMCPECDAELDEVEDDDFYYCDFEDDR